MFLLDVKEVINIGSAKKKREEDTTLKVGCVFKVKSYLLSNGCWSLNVVNDKHNTR
jgi:hypothetical protein